MQSNTNKEFNYRSELITEQVNSNSINLDQLSTNDIVKLFNQEDLLPQQAVSNAIPSIVKSIDLIVESINNGGRLIYIGAGTSGRLGVLDASECPPTFSTPPELVQGIIAGGSKSLVTSSEELEDSSDLSINDLKEIGFSNLDCLVGLTAGGTTKYVHSALDYSMKIGANTIAISCVPSHIIKLNCDVDIRLITGPEILAGSTRLKAGTATKMTLNIISTTVMIRLGKVYGNRMIDLSVSNNKLTNRSLSILTDISGVDKETAKELLSLSDGSVRIALFMALTGMNADESRICLDSTNNQFRKALKEAEM